ncbi:hypothetical protein ACFL1P_01225 [Patescibacteria group bacterium]
MSNSSNSEDKKSDPFYHGKGFMQVFMAFVAFICLLFVLLEHYASEALIIAAICLSTIVILMYMPEKDG